MPAHAGGHRRTALAVAALLAVFIAMACGGGDGQPPEPTDDPDTEEFTLPNFSSVVVESGFDVEITQSRSFDAKVRVGPELLELLNLEVANETLTIGLTDEPPDGGELREVSVTMPDLASITVRGASTVSVSGFRSVGLIELSVEDKSTLRGNVVAETFDLAVAGTSLVDLDIAVTTANVLVSGESVVVVRGSGSVLTVRAADASRLELGGFIAQTASAFLRDGSEATLNVQERIETAELTGASTLDYLGGATLGDISTDEGSTVEEASE